MRHLDLFSGIGGFALAASWVWGEDHELVAFCDNEPFCRKVLNKHWPDVPLIDDIRKIKGEDFESVDLITGGFPCQPFSCAGKRGGAGDDRYLWPEMLRVIQEIRPAWVIGENVAGIINVALDQVCTDLEDAGYSVQAFIVPACAVNAPHRRDRVWIIANRINERCFGRGSRGYSDENGIQESEQAGRGSWSAAPRCDEVPVVAPDSSNERLQRGERPGTHAERQASHGSASERNHAWGEPWLEVATRLCRVDDGVPNRVDRLKSLGNAIVPQVAAVIMQAIKNATEGE